MCDVIKYYDVRTGVAREVSDNVNTEHLGPAQCNEACSVSRSVIPYQWYLSHCYPSHTNAPLTPALCAASPCHLSSHFTAISSTGFIFCSPADMSDRGETGDCFDCVYCYCSPSWPGRPHSTIGNQLLLRRLRPTSCKPWLTPSFNWPQPTSSSPAAATAN